jgi:predicted RNA-binding Zn-ribbon protein involved in translation (DUF1610 family)
MSNKKEKKIIKCPECGDEIYYLINRQSGTEDYEMYPDGKYKTIDFTYDGDYNFWLCPDCYEELFNNEEDAIAFLNGRKKEV